MEVFIAMITDRHTDPEPYPFSTADAAIEHARQYAHKHASDPKDVEEEVVEGWLYYARYSTEGDSVWVLTKTMDG